MRTGTARGAAEDGAVFILYAVLAGLVIGLLTGGSAARLGDLRFRWAPLIALGMVVQLLLFSTPLGDAIGPAAPVVYVTSNVAVLVAVGRNLAIPGLLARPPRRGLQPGRDRRQSRLHAREPGGDGGDRSSPARGLLEQPSRRRASCSAR